MDLRPSNSQAKSETSYPYIEPHITLASMSNVSLDEIREAVGKTQLALDIRFQSVEVGQHFFRSAYIAVIPSPELVALHQNVHGTLGIESRTPSFPHISLCYISDEDAANGQRLQYKQALVESGKLRDNSDGTIRLNCGIGDEEDWLSGFIAPEIWITACDGPVEEWKVHDKIPLVLS